MKATLMLLGACALAPFAGGLAGASISTVPLASAGDPLAGVPRHETDFTGDIAYGGLDIPDHYPLVTRHGTIPVEELIFRRFAGAPWRSPAGETGRYAPGDEPGAPAADGDPGARPEDAADDGGEARRAADIAGLSPLAQAAAPSPGAALVPADPQLPAGARGMLTAVRQPAPPDAGANGSVALAQ